MGDRAFDERGRIGDATLASQRVAY